MEHFEIERKYLIEMPDEEALRTLCEKSGGEMWHITQTYLSAPTGVSSRVRRGEHDGAVTYYRTDKTHITDLKRTENERTVTEEEYLEMKASAVPGLSEIEKTRYRIPYGAHTLEIDVFPFWKRQAFLEIELASEDEKVPLPGFVTLIREVTDDLRYTNHALAREIPEE